MPLSDINFSLYLLSVACTSSNRPYIYIYVCMYVYVCKYVCMYVGR